jgi:hypothetical protein
MNKKNLFLDLGILGLFLIIMEPSITGISLHEWIGVAFAGTIIVHLLLHWKWIVTVGRKFFKKLLHVSRLKFMVDSLLFIAFTTVMMSGIMISRNISSTLGIQMVSSPVWRMLHSASANGTLILVGLHFALNWSWVVSMVKRHVVSPLFPSGKREKTPVLEPVKISKQ